MSAKTNRLVTFRPSLDVEDVLDNLPYRERSKFIRAAILAAAESKLEKKEDFQKSGEETQESSMKPLKQPEDLKSSTETLKISEKALSETENTQEKLPNYSLIKRLLMRGQSGGV